MLEINLRPPGKALRQFGFVALLAFGLIGGLIRWKQGLFGLDFGRAVEPVAYTLWALGAVSALLSLVAPRANRPLYVGVVVITYPIGFVVSHVLLGAIFFGLFTPLGLVFRLMRRDSLHRRFEKEASTYWVRHRPVESVERYFRQF